MELAELKTAIDEHQSVVTEVLQQTTKDLKATRDDLFNAQAQIDQIETRLNRPGAISARRGGAEETKAFTTFLRKGREGLAPEEFKSLRVSDDTAGGYLAPDEFIKELLRNIVAFSPIRGLARVVSITSGAALLPRRTGALTCSWVGEIAPRLETAPTYGQNRYDVREMACYVDCSNQMLEDSAFDIASELAFDFAEEFGRTEGAAFVSGGGVLAPFGILADDEVSYTASGAANALTADGLISLYHALPAPYRATGTWGANASTLSAIRKLKDGTGNYLVLSAGLAGQVTTTLLGQPIVEMPDLPDVGADTFPVVFGDFQAGFRIFDRVQLAVLRDPYSQATSGQAQVEQFWRRLRKENGGFLRFPGALERKLAGNVVPGNGHKIH